MALSEKQKEKNLPVIQLGPIKVDPGVEDFETELAHDPSCKGRFVYGRFAHTTWTMEGQQVEVASIAGYRCETCKLTAFLPPVSDELYRQIDLARAPQMTAE